MEMMDLLDLDYDGVKMVGISGPAGIGKTTIARALHSRLLNRFQLSCFVDNLRGIYHSGFDEYGLKLRLQEQFLSKILNHDGMRIWHLGAVKDNLCDRKMLIILDDVNNLNKLEALIEGIFTMSKFLAEHIIIFDYLFQESREVVLEFSFKDPTLDIIECGAYMWTDETIKESYASGHGKNETIGPFSASSRSQVCLRISRNKHKQSREDINVKFSYGIIGKSGYAINLVNGVQAYPGESTGIETEHLCIFQCDLPEDENICLKLGSEVSFEFRDSPFESCEIIECGVRILTDEAASTKK